MQKIQSEEKGNVAESQLVESVAHDQYSDCKIDICHHWHNHSFLPMVLIDDLF
jgi:hypothetical protein